MQAFAIDPLHPELGPCRWVEGRIGGLHVLNRDGFTKPRIDQVRLATDWPPSRSQRHFQDRLRRYLRVWLADVKVTASRPRARVAPATA